MRRRYRTAELIIAMLLSPAAEAEFPLGALVRLARFLRRALGLLPPAEAAPLAMREPGVIETRVALHRAVLGQGTNYLFLAYTDQRLVTMPVTDAYGPIAFDLDEVFQSFAGYTRPRIAFLLDLGIVAGVWEEQAPQRIVRPNAREEVEP
jgi:hypothetical protein